MRVNRIKKRTMLLRKTKMKQKLTSCVIILNLHKKLLSKTSATESLN